MLMLMVVKISVAGVGCGGDGDGDGRGNGCWGCGLWWRPNAPLVIYTIETRRDNPANHSRCSLAPRMFAIRTKRRAIKDLSSTPRRSLEESTKEKSKMGPKIP
jgi:hypothetical protein